MRLLLLLLCMLLLCLPLFAACGQQAGDATAEAMIENSTGADAGITRDPGKVDIEARDAHLQVAQAGKALQLPRISRPMCTARQASACAR